MTQTTKVAAGANAQGAWVARAFRALASLPGFRVRPAQEKLAVDIVAAVASGIPLVAEAPTGTGKTLAYLVGALAAATDRRVVVATATKALQGQLMHNDLPKLAQAGMLDLDQVMVAKGRSNYFCLKVAEDSIGGGVQLALPEFEALPEANPDEVQELLDALLERRWDGDFDTYPSRPEAVDRVRASRDTCTGRRCAHFANCPFFRARDGLALARVVVANHDLVLIDLEQDADEGEPVLGPGSYLVVFDEAHQLPAKAIERGARDAELSELSRRLSRLPAFVASAWRHSASARAMEAAPFARENFSAGPVRKPLDALIAMLERQPVQEDSGQYRYVRGTLSRELLGCVEDFVVEATPLARALVDAVAVLRALDTSADKQLARNVNEALHTGLKVLAKLKEVLAALARFTSDERVVRWLYRKDDVVTLHTCPLEGGDILRELLWDRHRAEGVVMVSATLRDVNGFNRFDRAAGVPGHARHEVLPYIFPYEQSKLTVAGMRATPKMAERAQYYAELRTKLPAAIDRREGALVLFPSWAMHREFVPVLQRAFGEDHVLAQGQAPVAQLIAAHRKRVDLGAGSILCGVATLAEGLDLPGDYCKHVVIMALPFAVPTTPVEQEIAELLGERYFAERSLPEAMLKLTQMVGRLLRRETDTGRVTVFDKRLAATTYGRRMLDALPPFRKVVEKATA